MSSTSTLRIEMDQIDFGAIPEPINELLQRGVVAYRSSPAQAKSWFLQALVAAPEVLAVYFCLYKIHTYQGNLDAAFAAAEAGLAEAARQAHLAGSIEDWPAPAVADGPSRFALYTLKALAFIELKRGAPRKASALLAQLERLDPAGHVGWPVVRDLMQASA